MKAILTGHSRGLGAAIGAELLARDIPVLGLARRANQALAARFPQRLLQHELDLGDTAALGEWLAGDALPGFLAGARSVVLINNAGIVQPVGPAAAQDPALVAQAVTLNVAAPLMLAAAVARSQAAEKRILHVSSGAARQAYPGWSVYCATKAALDHHARATVLDGVPGMRICSLAPGVIDTDMQAEIREVGSDRFPLRERFVALKREGQLTSPEDCARRLVDFLLAPGFGDNPVADLRD
ncbi:SDR family oxidoreductase [Noviherbaspirillum aridicola]|uniref:Short-chain dehydrogenase n=1 Tax=Noviherbaspirillum aridicola TaxID=2849687 RepID=A0ABQ4Q4M9_9BURK|nr:SDR family oxidoreductase [Noviherbaspirillum aridicola]GIZ51770.1 short-chain dehydrogenase [Noviherbaspirillum aridicola]